MALCTQSTNVNWGIVRVGLAGVTSDGVKGVQSALFAAKLAGKGVVVYWQSYAGQDACKVEFAKVQ